MKHLKSNKMFISIEELKKEYSYYKINKLVEQDILYKISKSMYKNNSYHGEVNDYFYVNAYVKTGVICLMSAAVYYGLSSYRPFSIEVAVERSVKVNNLPSHPTFEIIFFKKEIRPVIFTRLFNS